VSTSEVVPAAKPGARKKVTSKDFRTVVVSSIGASGSDNLVYIMCGLEISDPDSNEDILLEEVRLVMTPRTLKLYQVTLTNILNALEGAMGELPVPPMSPAEFKKRP
jgi:hypothetical protein